MVRRDREANETESEWRRAWVGLGANLGRRRDSLRRALRLVDMRDDCRVTDVSPFYETEAEIVEDQPAFINACAAIRTRLEPTDLMEALLGVETKMGRDRQASGDKGPRVIDLDLLVYGDRVVEQPGLVVPHPGIAERSFVLEPLSDIAPELVVPGEDATVRELLQQLTD